MGKPERFSLGVDDFAFLFGITVAQLPDDCRALINKFDFGYHYLDSEEKDRLILRILKRIDSPDLPVAGEKGKPRWENGWQENLDNFKASNFDVHGLIPKYIRPNEPIRLHGDYVMPRDSNFELNFYTVYRRWLFRTYLADAQVIYEFGCGPAHNLAQLAELYPEKELHGLEWVSPPQEIIRLLHKHYGYNITGHFFDMFKPDDNLSVGGNSAFLAIGSLEQLGINFEAFLQFTLRKKPAIFVQVDSISELYDENNLSDYLALKHNFRRNYIRRYLTRLSELEKEGRIEIIKVRRIPCGGLYYDGYSYIIWRPTPDGQEGN